MDSALPEPNIADAILTRQFDLKGGGVVTVYVWSPYPEDASGENFACPYKIVGIGNEKLYRGYGIDSIQAMMLTLQRIGIDLYASTEYKNGELTQFGSMDLDMPLIPGYTPGYEAYGHADLLTSSGYISVIKCRIKSSLRGLSRQ